MRRLRKFFEISVRDKLLFLWALLLVVVIRLGLTFTSYNFLKRWVPGVPQPRPGDHDKIRAVAIAVSRSARIVPYASCFTQALAGQTLLALLGYQSKIRIGVRRNPEGKILAHAWLLSDDKIVLGGGGHTLADYNILTDLKPQ